MALDISDGEMTFGSYKLIREDGAHYSWLHRVDRFPIDFLLFFHSSYFRFIAVCPFLLISSLAAMQSVYTALIPAARERESRQGIFDITIRPRLISFALFFLIRFYTTCLIPLQRVSVCFFFFLPPFATISCSNVVNRNRKTKFVCVQFVGHGM